jgi:hypothetical protein
VIFARQRGLLAIAVRFRSGVYFVYDFSNTLRQVTHRLLDRADGDLTEQDSVFRCPFGAAGL